MELLTIGELARKAGRRPSSIRYYERIGLLPEPIRIGGQRRYQPERIRALEFIEISQRAGLSLDQVSVSSREGAGAIRVRPGIFPMA